MQAKVLKYPIGMAVTSALAVILASVPLRADIRGVVGMAFFYGALASAWNLHALSGLISLGHAAFFGIGAYASVLTSYRTGLTPWVTIWIGGIFAGFYGLLWHTMFGHLRHGSYTLATFAAAVIPRVIVSNWESFTFGSMGIMNVKPLFAQADEAMYLPAFVIFAGCSVLFHELALSSKLGWALRTIREDELTAASIGVPVDSARLLALIVSAYLTGLAGAIYAHMIGVLEPSMVFGLHISAVPLVFSFFGGRFASLGPLLGAFILYCLDQFLIAPLFPDSHQAVYGLIIIVTLWFFPGGVYSWFQTKPKNV